MESLNVSIDRDILDRHSNDATWSTPYPPHGQGIFTFNMLRKMPFELRVCPKCLSNSLPQQSLSLIITRNKACFKLVDGEQELLLTEMCGENVGYNPFALTSYWFSFDCINHVLKYGKGYFMEETTILSYDFLTALGSCDQTKKRHELRGFFCPKVEKFLEFHNLFTKKVSSPQFHRESSYQENGHSNILSLCSSSSSALTENLEWFEFFPQPLIVNWPFAVKESSDISLFEIDGNNYILSGSLPIECQELYRNISSKKIDLDWAPDGQQVKLSDAIRYSFETEGKTLYNKLKSKEMKYIRVTVGPSRANSPGIPYVVELWPQNMGSPVHCHGNSYGVIKVLHGGLRVEIYNRDMETKLKEFNVKKGDVTWMSPQWYQSHRLFNDTSDFSATIQCYRYGISDTKQWPYFQYVKNDGSRGNFLPNSDFSFTELYETVLSEYVAKTDV